MHRRYRVIITIVFVGLFVASAGCAQLTGDSGSNETTEYHGNASEYLLTVNEVDNRWSVNQTRDSNFNIEEAESERVIEFVNQTEEEELTVVVMVMESPSDVDNFLDDQRTTYETQGLSVSNESIGDRSFTVTALGETLLDIKKSNVYIQVYGTPHLSEIKSISNDQIEKIEGG